MTIWFSISFLKYLLINIYDKVKLEYLSNSNEKQEHQKIKS